MRVALMLVIAGTVVLLLGASTSPVPAVSPPGLGHFVDKLATPVLEGVFWECFASNAGNMSAQVTIRFVDLDGHTKTADFDTCKGATLDPQKSCFAEASGTLAIAPPVLRCEINLLAGKATDLRGILESRADLQGVPIVRLAEAR